MNNRKYKHLFGPVPSRRFGRSLGIDLVQKKVCTIDCLFCQVGRTTDLTSVRAEYVPVAEVISELDDWKASGGESNFITLSGSGEPTLNSRFGDVINYVKQHFDTPMLVLTNGTLLHLPEVREAAAKADIVKASLSAWDQESFEKMNRPCPEITFEKLVSGEKAFRKMFKGELWLEVFILPGVNSKPEQVARIAEIAGEIRPDRVQLNTVARPPAYADAVAADKSTLDLLADVFSPRAEIIAKFNSSSCDHTSVTGARILAMLERRPCTGTQIADAFGIHHGEALKYITALLGSGHIVENRQGDELFFQIAPQKL
ncbi:MAG: radical SAM protein [Lentisphaerae bacterium]|nr:radical SAM protein [Lentisphaerota bacterium]